MPQGLGIVAATAALLGTAEPQQYEQTRNPNSVGDQEPNPTARWALTSLQLSSVDFHFRVGHCDSQIRPE